MKPPKHDFFYVCVDEIEQIKLIGTDLSEANNCRDVFFFLKTCTLFRITRLPPDVSTVFLKTNGPWKKTNYF